MGIWNGFDYNDIEIHMDENAAEQAAWRREGRADAAAERRERVQQARERDRAEMTARHPMRGTEPLAATHGALHQCAAENLARMLLGLFLYHCELGDQAVCVCGTAIVTSPEDHWVDLLVDHGVPADVAVDVVALHTAPELISDGTEERCECGLISPYDPEYLGTLTHVARAVAWNCPADSAAMRAHWAR